MRKINLLLASLAALLIHQPSSAQQPTVSFVLTQAPCNNDGILTTNVTGLTPPLTVTYYSPAGVIVHNNVTTLSDVLTSYSGAHLSVGIQDVNSFYASGTFSAPPFTYQRSIVNGLCPTNGTVTVTPSGGVAPYSYQWINTATSSVVSTLNPASLPNGIYGVRITDANGCVAGSHTQYDSIYINSQVLFDFAVNSTPANCTNGTATVGPITGTGTPPYTYQWSNNATTSSISNLTTGSYTVTVTDALGCNKMGYADIYQLVGIGASTIVTPTTCLQNDGAITTIGSGGVPPYSYLYSNGATTQTITGIPGGSYGVIVTDANGCVGSGSAYINSSTPISVTFSATASSCASPTGSATIAINGGQAPYNVTWNSFPQQTGLTATNLAAGSYGFQVVDANGCVRSGAVTVPPASIIAANIISTNPMCLQSNGSLNVTASGGTAPYSYLWSNSAVTSNISGLGAGSYSVTITDANGCSVTKSKSLTPSSPVNIGLATTPASCLFTSDGAIAATVIGGTAPYTYNWGNGQTAATVTGLATGYKHLSLTDAAGCNAYAHTFVGYNAANTSCYCTITGKVYHDVNNNCVQDAGEPGIPNVQIYCTGVGYAFTNASGTYSFKVPSGSYTISQTVQSTYPLASCQNNNIAVTTVAASGCVQTVNFANTVTPLHDVHISSWDFSAAVPGNVYTQKLIVSNQGTIAESNILGSYHSDGQINAATFTPSAIFNNPTANYYSTSGNTFPNLTPGANQVFDVDYNVPTNIPMGTILVFKDSAVHAGPMANWLNDNSPWNNVNSRNATVVSSYDPNFKQVSPQGEGPLGNITHADSVLEYMIHFQNLGTYKAQNVVVLDTLDDNLDWKSLRPIYSSHLSKVSIDDNGVLKYTFDNINLPAEMYDAQGSNGMFSFSIKMKPNLPLGTQLKNNAGIYFDYNEPIITNTTINTLYKPTSVDDKVKHEKLNFTIYPNPTRSGFVAVVENNKLNANTVVTITDVTGRIMAVKTIVLQQGRQIIKMNTESLNSGVYFVNINIDGKVNTQKLIVLK